MSPRHRETPEARLARIRLWARGKQYVARRGPFPRRAWVDEQLIDGVLFLVLSCGHLLHVHYDHNGDPYQDSYACRKCGWR